MDPTTNALMMSSRKVSAPPGSLAVASTSSAYVVATGYSLTITKPSGTVEGDLLICYVLSFGWGNFPTITTLSGWTKLIERTTDKYYSGNCVGAIYYKKAGASEPSSYTWVNGGSGNTYFNCLMMRITGAHATTPIDASASTNTVNPSTTYTFPSVTTTVANTLLLLFGGLTNNPVAGEWPLAAPSGFTVSVNIIDTVEDVCLGSAYKLQAATGATGSFTVTYNDADALAQGFTIAIKPA